MIVVVAVAVVDVVVEAVLWAIVFDLYTFLKTETGIHA